MTLTDPREALAEQSTFIDYLLGLTGLAGVVRVLADDPNRVDTPLDDDVVHLLLGLARVGAAVETLATGAITAELPTDHIPDTSHGRWLR